ncbi:MAG TPA: RDD family protein [Chromatiales bacterium]|nr:RDD family protein [Thiotrichales bacterium]HIP69276.1 RDD family protein [Chromatiales bacterium]
MLDTHQAIETPEGIAIEIVVAGPVSRALAWLLDTLIRSAIYIVLFIPASFLGKMGFGILMILIFFIEWFYPVYFEVLKNGATPGKQSLGLRVLQDDATPIGWSASIVRNLLRVVDFLPVFYGFGLITMLLNKDFKRLGDIVAGTVVVYTDKKPPAFESNEVRARSPAYPLQLEEQQAILSFAERSPFLTEDRAEELAGLTGPLVENTRSPMRQLLAISNWIAGKHR